MIPCKHAFCYACAILHGKEGSKMFPGCSNPVERIEKHTQGSLFMCGTVQGCKRSCLSRRDLKAHQPRPYKSWKLSCPYSTWKCSFCMLSHHLLKSDHLITPPDEHHMNHILPKQYLMILLPPLQSVRTSHIICHKKILVLLQQSSLSMNSPLYLSVSQEAESENLYISTRKHSNLVTVPIQNDSNSGTWEPLTSCLCNCSPSSWISGSTSGIELSWNYASTAIFYHATSSAISKSSKATSFPGHRYFSLDS